MQCALDARADGVVVLEFDSPSVALLPGLPVDLPVAIAGGKPEGGEPWSRAWIDDHAGAVMATEYLAGLGHRRIAYVGVPPAGHPDPRCAGWREVLATRGLPPLEPLATGWSVETGMHVARAVRAHQVTAVLCGNDDVALGLLTGLDRLGLRVPEDVSVVGMDDHPIRWPLGQRSRRCGLISPPWEKLRPVLPLERIPVEQSRFLRPSSPEPQRVPRWMAAPILDVGMMGP